MSKKRSDKPKAKADELWVAPRHLKGQDGNRAWSLSGNISPNSGARFLELADIALGLKKPEVRRKKGTAGAHDAEKKEPYTS